VWNLTSQPPAPPPQAAGDPAAGRGGGGGGRGGGGGGRGGGGGGGQPVQPGRYFAQLGKVTGGSATPIGPVQSFEVKPLIK
jgi:hypothetical protein